MVLLKKSVIDNVILYFVIYKLNYEKELYLIFLF